MRTTIVICTSWYNLFQMLQVWKDVGYKTALWRNMMLHLKHKLQNLQMSFEILRVVIVFAKAENVMLTQNIPF